MLTDAEWPAATVFDPGLAFPVGQGLRGRRYFRVELHGPWGDRLFAKELAADAPGRRRARREFEIGQRVRRAGAPCPRPWALWTGAERTLLLFEDLGASAAIPRASWRSEPGLLEAAGAAIAHLHDAGIRHRDLHAGNLLRRPDGAVLLSDFGKARAGSQVLRRGRLTDLGRLIGSLLPAEPSELARFAEAYLGRPDPDGAFARAIATAGFARLRAHHANLDRRARREVRGPHPCLLRVEREIVATLLDSPDPERTFLGPPLKEGSRSRVGLVRLADGAVAVLKHSLPRFAGDPRDRCGRSKALRSLLAAEGLRRRRIPAARPLAAWSRPGRGSWLLLEHLPAHRPLQQVAPELRGPARAELLGELAVLARWMHDLGVRYRDLKPSNVMVDPAAAPGARLALIDHDRNRFSRRPVARAAAMRDLAALHAGLPPAVRASERLAALHAYDPALLERAAWRRWVRPLLAEAAARAHRWVPRRLLAGAGGHARGSR